MFHFLSVIAVVLAVIALVVPVAAASACDDSHEDACAADCLCVCSCTSIVDCHAKIDVAIAPITQRVVISDFQYPGILLVADIFRPPTSA
ncbi:MAG: hypothetical protein BWK77_07065 [Verrucomicrobia bacterium A1]|nr:MAG: hypothetical protein BWK77_07065 [Verrucomicrobia bacterium A1]